MNLPMQEEWSPELLSELQRAVPVLESGTFDLASEGEVASESQGRFNLSVQSALAGFPHNSREDSGLRWGSWAQDAAGAGQNLLARSFGRESSGDAPPLQGLDSSDLLSEKAMALPMSTLTSGKRKTYPNKSTFQAHVCCVMDPLQVPRILESLQNSNHFQSVRSWPYAYRIISPFDGLTHEGSDDDNDAGAGEKMAGLLKRMGLENLLLVVSRWDRGNSNRLGGELFKCVNEQCKDLLKDLQQAVRASFPPEELMLRSNASYHSDMYDNDFSSGLALRDEHGADESGTCSLLSDGQGVHSSNSGHYQADFSDYQEEIPEVAQATRHIDLRAVGATPPPELLYASRGVCAQPTRHRSTVSASSPRRATDATDEGFFPGPVVQRCTMTVRSPRDSSASSQAGTTFTGTEGHGHSSASHMSQPGLEQDDFFITNVEASGHEMQRLSNDELLQMCSRLRAERDAIDEELAELGKYDKVMRSLNMPLFLERTKPKAQPKSRSRMRRSLTGTVK